jgi:hypothetical protein
MNCWQAGHFLWAIPAGNTIHHEITTREQQNTMKTLSWNYYFMEASNDEGFSCQEKAGDETIHIHVVQSVDIELSQRESPKVSSLEWRDNAPQQPNKASCFFH